MDTYSRYKIIPNEQNGGGIIVDSETGTTQNPICWQDIVAYYNYLVGLGRYDESQKLLAESIAGNKPISKMLEFVSSQISTMYYR